MKKKKEIEEVYSIQEELDKAKPYTEMYKKAYDFNTERFGSYAELMAFYQGNQHLLKKYKTERPWVVNMNTPYATVAIENRIASILVNDYEGDLIPLSPEDIDVIEPIDKVYKREWERLDIDKIIRNCVETSAVVREAYCHIIVDDKKIYGGTKRKRVGALNAEVIEPARVLIDPTARSLKDANYMIVLGRISKKEALKTYNKLESLKLQAPDYIPYQRGEVYYDNEEATCNDRLFNYSRPVQHAILKCDCLEFNIKYIFTFADDEFMKILKSFFEIKESIYTIRKCESIIEDILKKYRVIGMFSMGYEEDESYIKCKKMIGDSYNVINNTINELKRYFLVIDRSEFYMEGTYYKYVIE